jgi:citrate lyase subunit beta/citryl-CoA lyase
MRSLLFVPGDSERKLAKGETVGADALVLDLEDSVSADRIEIARAMVRDFLQGHRDRSRTRLWVRVNPLSTEKALPDNYLTALEVREGVARGSIRVLLVATETARSMFNIGGFGGITARLWGMTWGAEDLPAALGATTNRDESGELEFTYRLARSLCLLAAVAAEVEPIDTVFTDFKDAKGLLREAQAARRAGFTGKIAIHPDQVEPINHSFTPSADEIEYAQRVVKAFSSGAGTVALDGKMLDMPHLKQAQRVLRGVNK